MYLLFTINTEYQTESKSLLSVCTNKDKIHSLADFYCKENNCFYSSNHIIEMNYNNLTSGLNPNFELIVEEVKTNILLK